MKRILRLYFIEVLALYAIGLVVRGLIFEKGIETILITAAALALCFYLVKPILNILLLPLNLLTFGLFRWLSSTIAIYLVTLVVPGFKVDGFAFSGLSTKWIDIPALNFNGILAFIAFSFLISIITSLLHWLFR
jgi:putative membrane protein